MSFQSRVSLARGQHVPSLVAQRQCTGTSSQQSRIQLRRFFKWGRRLSAKLITWQASVVSSATIIVGTFICRAGTPWPTMVNSQVCLTNDRKQKARGALRMGVHFGVQVTSCNWGRDAVVDAQHCVTQVFNSACAVAYNSSSDCLWEPFARLVLEASYEGVLLAALLEAERHGGAKASKRVFLTCIGGGVFGNRMEWIVDAMQSALERFRNFDLDVRIVCYGQPELALERLVEKF